jgi:hypothetical protein
MESVKCTVKRNNIPVFPTFSVSNVPPKKENTFQHLKYDIALTACDSEETCKAGA